jgi:hypothetical protein
VVESAGSHVNIAGDHVQLRRNGIEFWSPSPFELWTEMTVAMGFAGCYVQKRGSGVVVSCEGDRHRGFAVSVLFLDCVPEQESSRNTVNPTLWS